MMVKLFAALPLLLVSVAGHAAVVGVAELQDGASILLQDEQGPCVGSARMASFVKAGASAVPGCWVARGHHIAVVFLDGDIGAVPVAALKPPKSA